MVSRGWDCLIRVACKCYCGSIAICHCGKLLATLTHLSGHQHVCTYYKQLMHGLFATFNVACWPAARGELSLSVFFQLSYYLFLSSCVPCRWLAHCPGEVFSPGLFPTILLSVPVFLYHRRKRWLPPCLGRRVHQPPCASHAAHSFAGAGRTDVLALVYSVKRKEARQFASLGMYHTRCQAMFFISFLKSLLGNS